MSSSTQQMAGPGIVNITVSFQSGTSSTNSCGDSFMRYDGSGSLIGGAIIIFEYQVKNGVQTQCNALSNYSQIIAHELGHALGLYDEYLIDPNACIGAIMSADPEYVFSDECQVADSNFTTPSEMPPPPGPIDQCSDYEYTSPCSPIVINFADSPYALTGANAPVLFDIRNSGSPVWIGWTAAGADEAFLWLDRNGNGVVDNGAELFGNATRLLNGARAPNGFEALREFDSNGDGVIDEKDEVWPRLRLWWDKNHNGFSEPGEITPLAGSGVTRIVLRYHWTNRHDRYGNVFRYESEIVIERDGAPHRKPVYDIFFVGVSP